MTQHEISTILQAIARLEVKVDGLTDDNDKADKLHADLEQRMRSVERTRAVVVGFALAFGGSAGALASKLLGA